MTEMLTQAQMTSLNAEVSQLDRLISISRRPLERLPLERLRDAIKKRINTATVDPRTPARATFTFKGAAVQGSHAIDPVFLGRTLESLCALVATINPDMKLKNTGFAIGSYGFTLEEELPSLPDGFDSAAAALRLQEERTLITAGEVLEAAKEGLAALEDHLIEVPAPEATANEAAKLLRILHGAKTGISLLAPSRKLELAPQDIEAASQSIAALKNITSEEICLEGSICSLNYKITRKLEFITSSNAVIAAPFSRKLDAEAIKTHLDRPCHLKFIKRTVGDKTTYRVPMQEIEYL